MRPSLGLSAALVGTMCLCPGTLAQSGGGGQPDFQQPANNKEKDKGRAKQPSDTPAKPEGASVDLRPKWEKGAEMRYVMRMSSENTLSGELAPATDTKDPKAKAEPLKQKMTEEIGLLLRVKDANPETGATVEIVTERVKVSIDAGGEVFDFDSEKPAKGGKDEGDLLGPLMKEMVGATMTVKFDNKGNITSVTGGGGLGLPAGLGQAGLGGASPSAESLFGPLKTRSSGDGRVHVGETWTNDDATDLAPLCSMRLVTKHTVSSFDHGTATVTFNGHIEPGSAAEGSTPLKIDNSQYRGKYLWDSERGQLNSMESEQEVAIQVRGQNGAGGGAMKSKQTVSVTRTNERGPAHPVAPAKPTRPANDHK